MRSAGKVDAGKTLHIEDDYGRFNHPAIYVHTSQNGLTPAACLVALVHNVFDQV